MQDDDIDKELLTPADEIPVEQAPKKRAVKKIKPSVEGINAPKTTRSTVVVRSTSADQREQAADDFRPMGTRLIPESVHKKNHHLGRWVGIFVILLILTAAGYEAYVWNINRNIQPIPVYGNQMTATQDQLTNVATTSTSTLSVLPVATSTPVVASATPLTQLTVNQTPTGYLNVRSTPASSGKLLTQIHPGETYPYTQTQNGWYQITLTDGTQGWVSGQYVTVAK